MFVLSCFFFSSRRRHTRCSRDWSSDVCSSDLSALVFGGDEFALVLPETNAEAANLVARRVCESAANDGKGPKLSVSVGTAVYPQNGDSIESLLCQADSELYSMKRQKIVAAAARQTAAGQ